MRVVLCAVSLLATIGGAEARMPPAGVPMTGAYTFTGTATVLSGGSACLGGSPLSITGDAVVSKGNTLDVHIKSSTDISAVGFGLTHVDLRYGASNSGTFTYVLLPQNGSYAGTYTAMTAKGADGGFKETMTISAGPFLIGESGTCQYSLDLIATPGANKALLKLLKGVL